MIEWVKVQELKFPFAKWLVMDSWSHLLPSSYTPYCKNIRVKNSTTTARKWYKRHAVSNNTYPVTAMCNVIWHLYVVVNWELLRVWVNSWQFIQPWVQVLHLEEASLLSFSNYLFLLDGSSKWRVMDTWWYPWGDTDDEHTPININIYDYAYPRFWVTHQYAVYLAWWNTNSNVLYKSAWAVDRNEAEDDPQDIWNPEDVYDFTWPWSIRYNFKSAITWMVSNRENLFVFTEDSIEVVDMVEWVWGLQTLISKPIAWRNALPNHKMVVAADDRIFFWNTDNMMKSINYIQWVTDINIGDISHRPDLSIKDFCATLDENQKTSFWWYHRPTHTVHWHLRQKWETVPNVVLVYDIENDSFYIDNNKFFSCVEDVESKYFAGSPFEQLVYLTETWNLDDWQPIERERRTPILTMWSPNYRKMFRQVNVYWEKQEDVKITVIVTVDKQEIFEWEIKETWYAVNGTATVPIATKPIAFEYEEPEVREFEYLISRGSLRKKWKNIQVIFKWSSTGTFCLSWMEIWYKDLYDSNVSDKAIKKQ